jgi:hypothetical protein
MAQAVSTPVTAISLACVDEPCAKDAPTSLRFEVVQALSSLLEAICAHGPQTINLQRLTIYHSRAIPAVSIRAYLVRIVRYATPSTEMLINVGVQIFRLFEQAQADNDPFSLHRLLGVALLVQAKFDDDFFYNNEYIGAVLGLGLAELNRLELDYLELIKFHVWIQPEHQALFMRDYLAVGAWPADNASDVNDASRIQADSPADEKTETSPTTSTAIVRPV